MSTATAVRLHKYYAEAHVLNGSIGPVARITYEKDNEAGYESGSVADFDQDGITIESGLTEVNASKNAGGGWDTQATSTLHNFAVKQAGKVIVSAESIIGQISTEHHAKGYVPSLEFGNTKFVNLQIQGETIKPKFDFNIVGGNPAEQFDEETGHPKPEKNDPYLVEFVTWPSFVSNVKAQGGTANGKEIHCSLVTQIEKGSVTIDGHVIYVPGFGKISLAELDVRNHFDLTMMRLTLDDGREITVAGPGTNGATRP
jgi:hypothetical protein